MTTRPFTLSPCHLLTLSLLLLTPALPAQTTRSATKPAIDRSSPEKTWTALCNSVKAGDVAAFRACYYNKNEVCTLFMNTYSDLVVTSFQLATALAPMGADGDAFAKNLKSAYTDMIKSGENRKTTITGDTAKWTRTLTDKKLTAEEFIASSTPTLKALKAVLADIQAKKITTVAQVKARLAVQPKP